MNERVHSTRAARLATPIDWSAVIDGAPQLGDPGIYSRAVEIAFLLHFLMADLEFGLDFNRAARTEGDSVTLNFQQSGIEATLWLMGEVWGKSKDMVEELKRLQDRMDAEDAS